MRGGKPVLPNWSTAIGKVDRLALAREPSLAKMAKAPFSGAVEITVASTQAAAGSGVRRLALGDPSTNRIPLIAGRNLIPHSLGRAPSGRVVVYQSAAADLFDLDLTTLAGTPDPAKWLGLSASAACTVGLVVY